MTPEEFLRTAEVARAAVRRNEDGIAIIPGPDGLEELDNPMPRWMTLVYVGTALWSLAYVILMPGLGLNLLGWTQTKAYEAELADAAKLYASKTPANPTKLAAAAAADPAAVTRGAATFSANCAACHGASGQGAIGPSLTDATWLYGATPAGIAKTIGDGTAKGMPPFKTSLSAAQVAEVSAFVHSLAKK